MSIAVVSNTQLADAVEAAVVEAAGGPLPGTRIVPVSELAAPLLPCDSVELLSWMGDMTAGPPTLAAEALRSAGRWAWVRYRWALEDARGQVKPTAEARQIRKHTRSLFSETVGVGAAGYLSCSNLIGPWLLGVINLDDSIDPLLDAGVIRRVGRSKRQPDYLVAGSLAGGPLELLAIECKGTVKGEPMAIGQLAAGVRQVLGVESPLPLRRIVFATTLALDGKEPAVCCHAIEVAPEQASMRPVDLDAAREALRDAALVRALRCAGRYELAARARARARDLYFPDVSQLEPNLRIAGRRMVGSSVEVRFRGSSLRAEVGVDFEYLQALAAPRPERGARLEPLAEEIASSRRRREQVRPDGEDRVREEERVRESVLMSDGIGVHFEQEGRAADESNELS